MWAGGVGQKKRRFARLGSERSSGVGVFGPSPVFFISRGKTLYSRLAKQARARGHAARGVTETQAPRASSRCHLPSKPKEPPAIARHSAITGNKPANQEGQLVAVDNRADLLRTLLFLGALGLYAMDIAPLKAHKRRKWPARSLRYSAGANSSGQ